jgi:hypothetical protein
VDGRDVRRSCTGSAAEEEQRQRADECHQTDDFDEEPEPHPRGTPRFVVTEQPTVDRHVQRADRCSHVRRADKREQRSAHDDNTDGEKASDDPLNEEQRADGRHGPVIQFLASPEVQVDDAGRCQHRRTYDENAEQQRTGGPTRRNRRRVGPSPNVLTIR